MSPKPKNTNKEGHAEGYLKKLPVWPEADVIDKTIDGLVPAARLESWGDFNDFVRDSRSDDRGGSLIFRGQHHYKWFLRPTLDRFAERSIDEGLAAKQLHNFRLSIRGRLADNSLLESSNDDDGMRAIELWAVGQHHGLATPLLDWTRSPYVALFFAFVDEDRAHWVDENGNPTNFSRAVFILNQTFLEDLDEPILNRYPRVVEPFRDDHGRLVNQAGLFSIAPHGETLESSLLKALVDSRVDVNDPAEVSKYLCKLHIPNSVEIRRDCLWHLREMNIHHASLFPDVTGASGYCNELAREYVANQSGRKEKGKARSRSDIHYWDSHTLPADVLGLKPLIDALLVNDQVRRSVEPDELRAIAKSVVDFINTRAGVDWYVREPEQARLRTIVRRRIGRKGFDDEAIADAAASIVAKAALLSAKAARSGREPSDK